MIRAAYSSNLGRKPNPYITDMTGNNSGKYSKKWNFSNYPVISVRPYVVLKPTIPQSADGILTEPVAEIR